MRSISDTIARLQPRSIGPAVDRLVDLSEPFANPGNLRARTFVPEHLPPGAALVVVLHGCTQTAAGYDHGSGWSDVADRGGFALLFPEQVRANNPNLCFNWFQDGDTTRGQGEVASVRAMIETMIARHALDPAKVFITGLSAGGAMTAAMLATYPEVFAGGAIIAGLPHGTASSVPEAMERMRGHGIPDARTLGLAVDEASSHRGAWPPVSVWHGSADATVVPATGEAVVAQWLAVHGLASADAELDIVDGHAHRVWRARDGRVAVESHVIAGMGHGTPLDTEGCGVGGAFMLDVGVSSTLRIAESWGLIDATSVRRAHASKPTPSHHGVSERWPSITGGAPSRQTPSQGVGAVIEDALRAAGLMR